MTRLNLLDALTSFTNEVMREILLPVRRQKGDEEEPAERPPLVYRQRLPDVKSATSKAPYILHQIVTGEDEQKPGEPTDSSVEVRSLFCVYGEDDQEGALRLLTTVEHFRQDRQAVCAGSFTEAIHTLLHRQHRTVLLRGAGVGMENPQCQQGGICMVKAKGKAGAKSAGFCMYIGPSIVGTIQQARILYGDKQDALAQISAAVEKYPLIATLVIPGDQVSEARIKVKTPGNLLYVNYHKLADRRKKEE